MTLSSCLPRGGPANGGTVVRLDGHGLATPRGALARCAFGNLTVAAILEREIARHMPSPQLRCTAPGVAVADVVMLRVSLDGGRTWAAGASPFTYYDLSLIHI